MRKSSWGEHKKSLLDIIIEKIRWAKVIPEIKNNPNVLDLGCGYEAPLLISKIKKIKTGTGIDISVSNNIIIPNVHLINGSLNERIDLPSNKFDLITALAIIEHLDKPKVMIEESFRLLKNGGSLIITTPSLFGKYILELLAFKLKLISQQEISDHKRYYTKNNLTELLIKYGFKKDKIKLKYFFFGLNMFAKATK
jgi:2-polyprenyl-3-methyl-5-hydroxy-6-metoxy-1,4-benzoquinol methylase